MLQCWWHVQFACVCVCACEPDFVSNFYTTPSKSWRGVLLRLCLSNGRGVGGLRPKATGNIVAYRKSSFFEPLYLVIGETLVKAFTSPFAA